MLGYVVSLAVLGLLGFGLYTAWRSGALSTEKAFKALGLNPPPPEELLAEANAGALKQPPPPVSVPEGACPYCGQLKDPTTGLCACKAPLGGVSARQAPAADATGPRLQILTGPDAGKTSPVVGVITLGRDETSAVPMSADASVSRQHARVEQRDSGFWVVDTGSTNGTCVNGARVTEALLRSGDEISLGQSRLLFLT
jgi:hypothetical protein